MSLAPGTRLGSYEIIAPLGAGGMGEVYKARDTRLDRTVALKVLAQSLADDPQFRDRFEREARAISQLTHPHICTLYDIGQAPPVAAGQPATDYLVLEYLEGETLAARIGRGPIKAEEALRIAIEVCEALERAHRAGILHRDLKPGNVMLTRSGAKLLDFGLAKTAAPSTGAVAGASVPVTVTTPLTAQGTILGTFQYMAPELVEGQPADARADIWAFGCLMHEMLTGRATFSGRTAASLFGAIMKEDPKPVLEGALPELDRIIQLCLAKDPDERIQTAHDLLLQLRWLANPRASSVAARPAGSVVRNAARERWLAAAAALFLITTIAAGVAILRRPGIAAPPLMRFAIQPSPDTRYYMTAGSAPWPAISPDGRLLVYVGSTGSEHMLWLQPLDNLAARSISGTEQGQVPFWSPDGKALGFFASGKLKTIDLATLSVQTLSDVSQGYRSGTWNADGVILFSHDGSGIYRTHATGGAVTPVTKVQDTTGTMTGVTHSRPSFLPDGKRFLFLMRSPDTAAAGIYLGSLESAAITRISPVVSEARYAPPGYLVFMREQTLVAQAFDASRGVTTGDPMPLAQGVTQNRATGVAAFSVSSSGVLVYRSGSDLATSQLTWYDRQGRRMGTLGDVGGYLNPQISPDDSRVVLQKADGDIWLLERARGIAGRLTRGSPLHSRYITPIWSADGSRVAYSADSRATGFDIFSRLANGTGDEEQISSAPGEDLPLGSTRDGKRILMTSYRGGPMALSLVTAGSTEPPEELMTGDEGLQFTQLSPDNRWIAYVSTNSGRPEVFVQQFPKATGRWQVSVGGGLQPRWRADAAEIFFLAPDQRLMAVSFDGSNAEPGIKTPVPLFPIQSVNGFQVVRGVLQQYAVTRDGAFLVNQITGQAIEAPITVVLNWTAGLAGR
jgi:Tol biopolymer transport system component/tRNA A-37 threonylcarbamoyl transferase component Bud32